MIGDDRLPDIGGSARAQVVAALERFEYSGGCAGCGNEVALEGRESAYPATFERFVKHPVDGAWPQRMEFNLSNSCNLQCIQCNGDLSSSIRIHREGKAPLPNPYDDVFFADLRTFIPHLNWAQFAGGEPFMAAENYRVWEMIHELNSHVSCHVVTNATQWNARVERIVTRVPMGFVFSIDAVTKPLYESIRIGADFDQVMANVERFRAVAAGHGTSASINFCLMAQNFHDFGNLLLYAEERGMRVDVSVVRDPEKASVAFMDPSDLRDAFDYLERQSEQVASQLAINLDVWHSEVARVGAWSQASTSSIQQAKEQWVTIRPPYRSHILNFPVVGAGPHDGLAARARLVKSSGGSVHEARIDEADRVSGVSDSFAQLLGVSPAALIGKDVSVLQTAAVASLGELQGQDVLQADDNEVNLRATYGSVSVQIALVAMRGRDGRAQSALILFAPLAGV